MSAVFTGVARDCAAHLPGVLENLGRFAATYRASSFLFVVSDSTDDTCAILERWLAEGRRGRVIELGALEERLTRRTERIAFARNTGLDEIMRGADAGHDHLVVADLDDVLARPVDADAFGRAAAWLDADPARTGVLANAVPRYYDVWALRHERWCPDDCWHPIWGRPSDETFEAAKFREVFTRQIEIPSSLPPIAVRSLSVGSASTACPPPSRRAITASMRTGVRPPSTSPSTRRSAGRADGSTSSRRCRSMRRASISTSRRNSNGAGGWP